MSQPNDLSRCLVSLEQDTTLVAVIELSQSSWLIAGTVPGIERLPRVWHAATTTAAERKRLLRFVIREVVLDQKRAVGQVWLKILWQTGATSEHSLQRRVHTYRDYLDLDRLRQRIAALNRAGKMDKEIAAVLSREGFVAARGCAFKGENVWLLRQRWGIPTVKINGTSQREAARLSAFKR